MELFIGADHRGFRMKQDLLVYLHEKGYEVTDVGTHAEDSQDDYPLFAEEAAHAVAQDPENRRAILLCGSGAGMAIAANKVKGIRAALIHDVHIARNARHDDNINILALGADYISQDDAEQVVSEFLKTSFSNEEKYTRRLKEIEKMERGA